MVRRVRESRLGWRYGGGAGGSGRRKRGKRRNGKRKRRRRYKERGKEYRRTSLVVLVKVINQFRVRYQNKVTINRKFE